MYKTSKFINYSSCPPDCPGTGKVRHVSRGGAVGSDAPGGTIRAVGGLQHPFVRRIDGAEARTGQVVTGPVKAPVLAVLARRHGADTGRDS